MRTPHAPGATQVGRTIAWRPAGVNDGEIKKPLRMWSGVPYRPGMDRRRFLLISLPAVLVAPPAGEAQESTRSQVAFLGGESSSTNQHYLDCVSPGLADHGYVEG